jgi:hypothetical protein
MDDRFIEQRVKKCCVKLGENANDDYEILPEVYGGDAVRTLCFE